MRRTWIRVLSVVFLTFFASSLCAQPTLKLIGNNVDISRGLTLQRAAPSVAYNIADNEYMVVWFGFDLIDLNVFGQRLAADGGLVGENIPIINEVGAQLNPFVTYNSLDNNYLVAWWSQFDGPGSPDFNDAFGRLVSNEGIFLGDPFHISDAGLEISSAYNSTNNEYLVTGRSFASGPVPGILGQILSSVGSLLGNDIVINTAGAPAPNGQVAYNPSFNEYFATWRDQENRNLKGRRIFSTGVLLGNPIIISAVFPYFTTAASVAFDPLNNRYLVVFSTVEGRDILGQFVSGSGELIGDNFLIHTVSAPSETPSVAHSVDNVFFVTWRDGNDILGQLLSETGEVIGLPLVIAKETASGAPKTVHNTTTGDFLVVWPDDRNVPSGEQDIFAQLVGLSTEPIRDNTPPVISGLPSANCTLWPPNRQLVQVGTVAATDPESGIAPGSFNVTGGSNEPLDTRDIVITPNASGAFVVQLRAERLGKGKGRIYTLNATAADLAGNRVMATSTCLVPHDQGR